MKNLISCDCVVRYTFFLDVSLIKKINVLLINLIDEELE